MKFVSSLLILLLLPKHTVSRDPRPSLDPHLGRTICATPENFVYDTIVTFEEYNPSHRVSSRRFRGPCGQIPYAFRSFVGWDWPTVTCNSFKTDEHKYIISQVGQCCSDDLTVCDV